MWKVIVGSLLIVISLFMLLGFMGAELEVGFAAEALTFALLVLLPGLGGAALIYSHFHRGKKLAQRQEKLRRQTLEAELLRLAAAHGGKLTVAEVVLETSLDSETAEEALSDLHRRGLAQIELTESGNIVYAFHGVANLSEKETAKGVLDA